MYRQKKGFTLAELLIVVAIIAVLVAIAIPFFNVQLEKSRESTDLANVRGAYAEVMVSALADDQAARYQGERIYVGGAYVIEVPLVQREDGWRTKEGKLIVGGVSAEEDRNTRWFDDPIAGGYCTVTYEDGEVHLYWSGQFYDYVSPISEAISKTTSRSNCFNSTCDGNGTVAAIIRSIADDRVLSDIKTWAVVRNPSDTKKTDYSYILSTIGIKDLTPGSKIPALYCDKNGVYTVGYATVNLAPDKNNGKPYNLITIDAEGRYCCQNNNIYSPNYQVDTLISEGTTYSSRAAAQYAYQQLEKKYLEGLD